MAKRKYHSWTKAEIEILMCPEWTAQEVADMLGVTVLQVRNRRKYQETVVRSGRRSYGVWHGCNQTCPDFCPYDECFMPSDECAKSLKGVHSIAGERAGLRNRDDAPGSKPIPTVTLPTIVKRSI